MNALHYDTNVELSEAFDDFKQDDESWVAIVTGAGNRAFSAGNDLKATAAAIAKGEKLPDFSERVRFGGITSGFVCNKPIIAAVECDAEWGSFRTSTALSMVHDAHY